LWLSLPSRCIQRNYFGVEATRKRLEALLAQLEHATATADHTIAEVRAALRELESSDTPPARDARTRGKAREQRPAPTKTARHK
jgi:hypothetical protein